MITAGFSNLFSRPPHGLRLGLRPNPAIKRRCQESVSQRQRREMLKPGPSAQVQVRSSFRALKARNDRGPTSMANHFAARVAISRFQRLKTHRRSHPGRCPGLLHFAPLALGIQVLLCGLITYFLCKAGETIVEDLVQAFFFCYGFKSGSTRSLPLHFFQSFRNERSDLMRGAVTISERLIQSKVRQRQTSQRRLKVVAGVDADRAVKEINAVTAQAATPWQKRRRGVAKDTGLAVIAFVEVFVARPKQGLGRTLTRVFSFFQTCMNVNRVIVFVIKRQLPQEVDLMS